MEVETATIKPPKRLISLILGVIFCLSLVSNIFLLNAIINSTKTSDHEQSATQTTIVRVTDNETAIRFYLDIAQKQAEIFRYLNNNSYSGLCEHSESLFTLEGGVLKFIKKVGATEVFCFTSSNEYLIEAQLPVNKMFYCIDNTNEPTEQTVSREGNTSCQ